MTEPVYRKRGTRYKPTTLSEQGAWGWQDLMVLAAFRYCLGRSTYITGTCADWLVNKWQELPPHSKALIRTELDRAFVQDDENRATGASFKALGWDCDRAAWEKVRALWAGEQPPAQPCEMAPAELTYRMKWLAAEMDTVGRAMVRQAQSTGDAELRGSGWDLQDAAEALLASIKDKT
jgi:hypothetical protein